MDYLLSEKQHTVLDAVNRFGVLTSTQLTTFLKGRVSHVSVYDAKKKIVKLGFMAEEKVGRHLILYIRPKGVTHLGSNLTAFTKLSYTYLNHTIIMNDCVLELLQKYQVDKVFPIFYTERELRSNFIRQNFDLEDKTDPAKLKAIPERIPDFVIETDKEAIAYEVELTQKAKKRYVRKLEMYLPLLSGHKYDKVQYLCAYPKTLEMIENVAQDLSIHQDYIRYDLIENVAGAALRNAIK